MQEAFLRVWGRWERVRAMDDPRGYLYRTAMNVLRSRHRRALVATRRVMMLRAGEDPFVGALGVTKDPFAAVDTRDAIVRALRRLPPRERLALIAIDYLDMSSDEAGKALGVRGVTVRSLASQARARLRAGQEA